jgi:long-chain fatty acid transport protein
LDIHGEAEVNIAGAPDIGPSRTNVPVMLPQQIGLGYAVRPAEPLKVEFNVIWTDWNAFDRFRVGSSDPIFNNSRIPADWRSGFTYRLGGQYELNDHWTARAGYAYADNAIPEATYTPIVPDSEYHLFALGLGYTADRWSLDLAYQLIYRETRDISNSTLSPTIDGEWRNTIHTVSLSATYRF